MKKHSQVHVPLKNSKRPFKPNDWNKKATKYIRAVDKASEMSQNDFALLAVQFVTSEAEVNCIPMSEPSAALECAENEENCLMELDDSVHHAAFESSIPQSMHEPTRFLHSNAPPRRFHRTIWRSMAIRILALSSK